MTREAFIERWKRHVVGVIVTGTSKARTGGSLTFHDCTALGSVVVDIHDEAVKLLGQLYDSLQTAVTKPANGQPQGAKK